MHTAATAADRATATARSTSTSSCTTTWSAPARATCACRGASCATPSCCVLWRRSRPTSWSRKAGARWPGCGPLRRSGAWRWRKSRCRPCPRPRPRPRPGATDAGTASPGPAVTLPPPPPSRHHDAGIRPPAGRRRNRWRETTMFDKFQRSWEMVKASAAVLRSDRELMLFPVLSGLATLLVMATFALPTLALKLFSNGFSLGGVLLGFAFYFCTYSVMIFFNCALVGAAMIRLEGGDPTLSDGLSAARARMGAIFGYAAIAATVGVILQGLKGKDNNVIVRLVGSGLGMAWTLATFLVVPVLVSRDIGPVDALKQSVTLLKRTWGENAVGQVGIGAAFGVLTAIAVLVSVGLVVLAAQASVALRSEERR